MPKPKPRRRDRAEFAEPSWSWNREDVAAARREALEASASESSKSEENTPELDGLPVEVVERILAYLPGNEIAAFKRVSRWFREVVEGSIVLQYIIECLLAGVVDNPARSESIRERLKCLKEWRTASKRLEWTESTIIEPQDLPWAEVQVFGSVYLFENDGSVTIVQPPSKVRGRAEKRWTVNWLDFAPAAVAYDHNEKVLAFLDNQFGGDEGNFLRVHLLSLDGTPHPSSSCPIMKLDYPSQYERDVAIDLRLFGDKAFLVMEPFLDEEIPQLSVWNWQTGKLCMPRFVDNGTISHGLSFDFLSSNYALSSVVQKLGKNVPNGIVVLPLVDKVYSPESRPISHLLNGALLVLEMPEPAKGAEYSTILISCNHPSSKGNNDFFYRPLDRGTVYITVEMNDVRNNSFNDFHLFLPSDVILALVETSKAKVPKVSKVKPGPTIIPWAKWGYHTRIFDISWDDTKTLGPSWWGRRLNEFDENVIFDFDTAHAIKADWHHPHFSPRSSIVYHPTKSEWPAFFAHRRVWTSLPYRRHVIQLDDAREIRLGEGFMIELDPPPEFGYFAVHTI